MDDQKRVILELLEYIASQKRALDMITNFRGVPIHLAGRIIRCSQTTGAVRLRVHHPQIRPLKTADKILLQSDLFPNLLVAEIDQIDFHSEIITLRDLCYVIGSMGNRKNMRVEPESPIHVELILGHGYNVQGEMVDISLDGLSIHLTKDAFPQDDLFMLQTPVEIRLGLPVSGNRAIHDISAQGNIAYTIENQRTFRIGLLTFLKEPDLGILRRYIFDRQTEILNETQLTNSTTAEVVL